MIAELLFILLSEFSKSCCLRFLLFIVLQDVASMRLM